MYDARKYEAAVEGVRRIAARPSVASISDHFAQYFDEMGMSITVADDTPDRDIIALRNEIATFLEAELPGDDPFKWIVSFGRRGKTVEVISSGCGQLGLDEKLPELGKHEG